MAAKTLLIVQHMPWEGPGEHLLAALKELGLSYQVAEAWHEPLPSLDRFAGLIVLGGSPNVDEDEGFPYLRPLKAMIRETIDRGRAYLGFCLGHQLLAHVLGAAVGPLAKKSVGFITGRLTPRGLEHPAFQGLDTELELFKWHGQGVLMPVPHGLAILATSPAAKVEALGIIGNPRVVGLQFDNHAGPEDVKRWLENDADWALSGSGADPEAIMRRASVAAPEIGRNFRRFMLNFCRIADLL
ncbi:MAG: type 1 glutamine amidotransferase [Deltaproteobacteria bacterium]|nr:type 1 glutamine amidotransferase [Deltaproteobacteria bacterium]